ncbi:MAG: hypothetical protein KF889_10525 [Alphaproteobacteria bacterium]|nr:hypothetical protein [Alphaproteobacteria bacterium]MCW5741259.1 hypothetical protein [Alphaproteobacteria bacterium]
MEMIRRDLAAAQAQAWSEVGEPGTWWNGAERVAIAAETRRAAQCRLCAARKVALSPSMAAGDHDTPGVLPAPAIEAIHRIRTDPGRLGHGWYRGIVEAGLDEERYVELVSVIAITVAVDTFRRASGLEPWRLPAPKPGMPTRRRPTGAKPGVAWMATLLPDDCTAEDPDLYQAQPGPRRRGGGYVHHALSLVPRSMMHWWDMFEVMYLPSAAMRDFAREYRAVSHAQIELLASRVAALNQCVY